MIERHHSLDYLRGSMAVSVMLYHYASWSIGAGDGVLSKLGIYAVSVFYVLSGLSLTLAYKDRLANPGETANYALKRIFRIVPLFWLATIATIAIHIFLQLRTDSPVSLDFAKIVANFTLMFGFFAPDSYYATGAWSIGNEIVFYAAFPFVLAATRATRMSQLALGLFSLSILLVFAFFWLSPETPLAGQWRTYINPFNQFPFFAAGMLIAYTTPGKLKQIPWMRLSLLAVLVFCAYPVSGDQIGAVSGTARLVLSASSVFLVLTIYGARRRFWGRTHVLFSFLGEASYSIYLLHPVVAVPIMLVASRLGVDTLGRFAIYLAVCVPLTLACSWLSHRQVEQRGIRLGQRLIRPTSDNASGKTDLATNRGSL